MSDAAAPEAAADIPAIPLGGGLGLPTTTFGRLALCFGDGWRPAAGWACVGILIINGAVLPLTKGKALDWPQLMLFAGLLLGHGALRTFEKATGATQ